MSSSICPVVVSSGLDSTPRKRSPFPQKQRSRGRRIPLKILTINYIEIFACKIVIALSMWKKNKRRKLDWIVNWNWLSVFAPRKKTYGSAMPWSISKRLQGTLSPFLSTVPRKTSNAVLLKRIDLLNTNNRNSRVFAATWIRFMHTPHESIMTGDQNQPSLV